MTGEPPGLSRAQRRQLSDHRCPECRLHRAVCLCALLPTLPTRTRVVLILHQLEQHKPTNTGRLALRCLPNSAAVVRGRDATNTTDLAPAWLTQAERPVLLFPADDARPIDTFASGPPLTLIVPDGTWSQASRTRKRFPGLDAIPAAHLPPELVSTYRLRHDPRPGRLSTLAAIAHALAVLEGPATAEALLRVHQIAVERTLFTKGRLAADQVTGGLPRLREEQTRADLQGATEQRRSEQD